MSRFALNAVEYFVDDEQGGHLKSQSVSKYAEGQGKARNGRDLGGLAVPGKGLKNCGNNDIIIKRFPDEIFHSELLSGRFDFLADVGNQENEQGVGTGIIGAEVPEKVKSPRTVLEVDLGENKRWTA